MRRVLEQQAALLKRLHNERNISLFQVSDATMNQLRAAAGRAPAEVALLQQENVVASGGRINCDSGARGASTDHDQVPRPFSAVEALVHRGPGHLTLKKCEASDGCTAAVRAVQ